MEREKQITWNVQGGQINIAKDNSTICATQNNYSNTEELEKIINNIVCNLSDLTTENKEAILDAINMAKEELVQTKPKTSRLRNCVTLLSPMLTIANGVPTLAQNIDKLIHFIESYIH